MTDVTYYFSLCLDQLLLTLFYPGDFFCLRSELFFNNSKNNKAIIVTKLSDNQQISIRHIFVNILSN